jgi:predicted dehydrogenase
MVLPVGSNIEVVKIGLIGCGRIARSVHLKILRNTPAVRVTAIAEPDTNTHNEARRLAPDACLLTDYQSLLARDDVDAVVLALPTGRHAEAATAAFAAGKHVYLEKPLATNLADAETVLQAWQRGDRVGMIGFNYRFNKLCRRARQLLRQGVLGEVIAVRSVFSSARRPLPSWKMRRATGGGVLLDLASHHIDLVRFLLDTDVLDVTCDLQSRVTEDDTAFLKLRVGNGATVQSFFSFCSSDDDLFEIHGTAGEMTIDRCHGMDVRWRGSDGASHRADQLRHWVRSIRGIRYGLDRWRSIGHEPSWQQALEHFIGAVRGEHPAEPTLRDGYESLKVVVAAEEADRSRKLQG